MYDQVQIPANQTRNRKKEKIILEFCCVNCILLSVESFDSVRVSFRIG